MPTGAASNSVPMGQSQTPASSPLALTDDELDVVRRFAQPLPRADRDSYLRRVAALLVGREIGPGILHRVCEQAQLELRRPPTLDGRSRLPAGKYT